MRFDRLRPGFAQDAIPLGVFSNWLLHLTSIHNFLSF